MTDTAELIERLRTHFDDCPEPIGQKSFTRPLLDEAATALETLQAENERLRTRCEALDGLLSADDMWTDYGSGYRIHFSFVAGSNQDLVRVLNDRRAALAATKIGGDA